MGANDSLCMLRYQRVAGLERVHCIHMSCFRTTHTQKKENWQYRDTVDSFYPTTLGTQSKCPDWRDGLISGVDLYYKCTLGHFKMA